MEKHPQAELIKLVVDGLAVPQRYISLTRGSGWYDQSLEELVNIGKYTHADWRSKPTEPEKVYPVTKMSNGQLRHVFMSACPGEDGWDHFSAVANAAIRHALDNGYLFTQEDIDEAEAGSSH